MIDIPIDDPEVRERVAQSQKYDYSIDDGTSDEDDINQDESEEESAIDRKEENQNKKICVDEDRDSEIDNEMSYFDKDKLDGEKLPDGDLVEKYGSLRHKY